MRYLIAIVLISLSGCASLRDPEVFGDSVELIEDIIKDELSE